MTHHQSGSKVTLIWVRWLLASLGSSGGHPPSPMFFMICPTTPPEVSLALPCIPGTALSAFQSTCATIVTQSAPSWHLLLSNVDGMLWFAQWQASWASPSWNHGGSSRCSKRSKTVALYEEARLFLEASSTAASQGTVSSMT